MKKTLKKYFIPHAENNFHPHILHTKRAVFYGLVFLVCKAIIVFFALSLPTSVFTAPDILSQEAKKIAVLTNELRTQKSIGLLSNNSKLAIAATAKATDMVRKSYFSHTSPSGQTVADFVAKSGYHYVVVGENLAIGFATAEDIMAAWENSPTHYANLVDKDYLDLGVSLEVGDYKGQTSVFAVQHFAEPVNLPVVETKPKVTTKSKINIAKKPISVSSTTKNISSSTTFQINSTQTTSVVLSEKIAAPITNEGVLVGQPFWENPVEKYQHAKEISSVNNIFGVSRNIFLFAIMFFGMALLLSVFIEFKKQKPHIIAQTTGLIGLLAVLFLM